MPGWIFSQNSFSGMTLKKYKQVHGIFIGISAYEVAPKLKYAHKDAERMYELFKGMYPTQSINMKLLTNESASEIAIKTAIRGLVEKAKEGDLVVFFFSGHGDVVKEVVEDETGYFLAYNAGKDRIYELGGAVEFDYVNKAITKIVSVNKAEVWMLTDACKSGAVVNTEGAGFTMTTLNEGFKNTTKFVSCAAHELSYEDSTLQQGVFTYHLIKGIAGDAESDGKSGVLNVDEINTYLKNNVRSYTSGKQTPKVSAANEYVDILAANPEWKKLIRSNATDDLAMANTGKKGDGDAKSKVVMDMEALIQRGDLHSVTVSAHALYKQSQLDASISSHDKQILRDLLIEALLDRAQRGTNKFTAGLPLLSKEDDFETVEKDLNIAIELIEASKLPVDGLRDRRDFFTAMKQIQSGKKDQVASAEKTLLLLAQKQPDAAHINQGLALLYLAKSDKTAAEKQLEEASLKIKSWSKPTNTNAHLQIIFGQLDKAKQLIQNSESTGGTSNQPNTYLLRAQLHAANYELMKASEALSTLSKSGYASEESKKLLGEVEALRGRIKVAAQHYQSLLNENASNSEVLIRLGDLYRTERDTVKALDFYKKARNLEPDNQSLLASIALLSRKEATIDPLKINPGSLNEVLQTCEIYHLKKDYSAGVSFMEQVITQVPNQPEYYYQLGKMQYSNGNEAASQGSLLKALEISPYHFNSIRALAYMYLHQKKYKEADALIKKYEANFPQSAKYITLSFQVYRQMGSKNDLFPLLERALTIDSLETDAYKALYQLHLENNDFDNAVREFRNLMELGGGMQDSIDFYSSLAKQVRYNIDLHQYFGMRSGIKLLLDLDPYDFEMAYFMGLICYMEKDYDAASKAIQVFSKDIQSFSPSVQMEFYKLKAKINLEIGHPDLSERLFGMTVGSTPPDFLGLSMAQFDQGKENWIQNFQRAGEPIDYNEDALKRYEKMRKKAGKSGPSYGGEQMRR